MIFYTLFYRSKKESRDKLLKNARKEDRDGNTKATKEQRLLGLNIPYSPERVSRKLLGREMALSLGSAAGRYFASQQMHTLQGNPPGKRLNF